jgi:hypothetical protein
VVGGLAGQLPDPTGQAPQGGRGGGGLDIPIGVNAQPGTSRHQLAGRVGPEPFPYDLRCRNDQGVELALGITGGLDRRTAGRQPHRQRGPWPGRPGLGQLVTAQSLAGGPGRIQRVGLGPVAAGGPLGPIQLDHLLVMACRNRVSPAP